MAKSKSDKLEPKEEAFCQAYVSMRKKKDAAIAAGYSATSAPQIAWQLLQKSEIQRRIAAIEAECSEHWIVDSNWVLSQFVNTYRKCSRPEAVRTYNHETQKVEETGEYKFDSTGAIGALNSIAKHIGFFQIDNNQKKQEAPAILVPDVDTKDKLNKLLDALKDE